MSIFISVFIKSKPGHAADLKPFLLDLVHESRGEKACLQYNLYQCIDNEDIFIINEEWLEQLWFELHSQQEHVGQFKAASDILIEIKIIHRTEKIF
jgi:quinol monooxygenase YgiN